MRKGRTNWSQVILILVAVVLLQSLAGTANSPVERLLHIQHVSRWWPYILAGVGGIVGGSILSRRGPGSGTGGQPAARGGSQGKPATRGRYAVPRHVRRQRERDERHQRRLEAAREREDQEERERQEREREEEAAAAAAGTEARPPIQRWLGRLAAFLRRGSGA